MKKKNIVSYKSRFISILSIAFFLIVTGIAQADVVTLLDGTVINGKITMTKENGDITVTNYYGSFEIKKELILLIQRTASSAEDLDIYKKMGRKVDQDAIKRNYDYGQQKWEEMLRPGKRKGYFSYINCSLSTIYLATFGGLKNELPWGQGIFASAIVGMHESIFIDARAELGYLYYHKDDITVSGIVSLVGGMWYMPITKRHSGRLHLALLPGVTYLNKIEKTSGTTVDTSETTFTFSATVGYDYPFKKLMVFADFRYLYIYDIEYPLTSFGFEVGVSYRVR